MSTSLNTQCTTACNHMTDSRNEAVNKEQSIGSRLIEKIKNSFISLVKSISNSFSNLVKAFPFFNKGADVSGDKKEPIYAEATPLSLRVKIIEVSLREELSNLAHFGYSSEFAERHNAVIQEFSQRFGNNKYS